MNSKILPTFYCTCSLHSTLTFPRFHGQHYRFCSAMTGSARFGRDVHTVTAPWMYHPLVGPHVSRGPRAWLDLLHTDRKARGLSSNTTGATHRTWIWMAEFCPRGCMRGSAIQSCRTKLWDPYVRQSANHRGNAKLTVGMIGFDGPTRFAGLRGRSGKKDKWQKCGQKVLQVYLHLKSLTASAWHVRTDTCLTRTDRPNKRSVDFHTSKKALVIPNLSVRRTFRNTSCTRDNHELHVRRLRVSIPPWETPTDSRQSAVRWTQTTIMTCSHLSDSLALFS